MKPKVDPKFRGAKGGNGGKKIKGVKKGWREKEKEIIKKKN